MMKTILPFFLLVSAPMFAQPVIDASTLVPSNGPTALLHFGSYVTPGPATASFMFDASGFEGVQTAQSQYVAPASTPYGSYFPTATQASGALTNPSLYSYTRSTATEVFNLGYYGPSSSLVYSDPEKLYAIPMNYNLTFSDPWSAAASNQGQAYTRTGTTTVSYNGYGTVIMPAGSYTNCARFQIDQIMTDDFQGQTTIDYVARIVAYIKPGVEGALFTSSYTLYDFGAGFDTLQVGSFAVDEAVAGIHSLEALEIMARIYPNPATDQATIQLIETPGSALSATLLDATGRVIRDLVGADVAFKQQVDLDISDLHAGTYFVRLRDATGRTGTLPLIKE